MSNNALDFYHGLEGGPIANQRPPPPGIDAPYPNLGTTPARPPAADLAAEQAISDRLASQRDAATAAAAQDPLRPPPPAPAPPAKPAAPDPDASKVVVDAAPAPPAAPAPVPAPASPSIDSVPEPPAAIASGPLPALANAPPPMPTGLEVAMPAQPPLSVAPAKLAAPANGVAVAFTPGSATLPPSATLTLRRFALAHRGAKLAVTGRGDGVLPDPDAQSRALDLALKRAAAIAESLGAAGVQPKNLRLAAEARGTGSTATLN